MYKILIPLLFCTGIITATLRAQAPLIQDHQEVLPQGDKGKEVYVDEGVVFILQKEFIIKVRRFSFITQALKARIFIAKLLQQALDLHLKNIMMKARIHAKPLPFIESTILMRLFYTRLAISCKANILSVIERKVKCLLTSTMPLTHDF